MWEHTDQFVNEYQKSGLGVLGALHVTIDGDSPSLILARIAIGSQALNSHIELGSKQENVNAAVAGDFVEVGDDEGLQGGLLGVDNQISINIDYRTTLQIVS
jgi:hypothetical protein